MFKKVLFTASFLALSLAFPLKIFAAALAVTSIGSLSTTGTFYSSWWYTAQNPTLSGVAAANATVTITIDGTAATTTANASGAWSYQPTTLTTGEHTIAITSGAESVNFSLTIGSDVPSTTTTTTTTATTPATLPDTGIGDYTWLLAIAGIGALGFGTYSFVFAKEK